MALGGEGELGAQQAWATIPARSLHHLPVLQVAVRLADLAGAAVQGDVPHQLERVLRLYNLQWRVDIGSCHAWLCDQLQMCSGRWGLDLLGIRKIGRYFALLVSQDR